MSVPAVKQTECTQCNYELGLHLWGQGCSLSAKAFLLCKNREFPCGGSQCSLKHLQCLQNQNGNSTVPELPTVNLLWQTGFLVTPVLNFKTESEFIASRASMWNQRVHKSWLLKLHLPKDSACPGLPPDLDPQWTELICLVNLQHTTLISKTQEEGINIPILCTDYFRTCIMRTHC